MAPNTLEGYYYLLVVLKKYKNWTKEEIENMYPWELEAIVAMTNKEDEEAKRRKG